MEVFIRGQNPVKLTPADFVGQGGEGSIYSRGDIAYKIYSTPHKMIPLGKIQELSVLTYPSIIRPQEILLDHKKQPVGYTMKRVAGGVPLCQLFNRSFRDRMGVTPDNVITLIRKLQEGVKHVHKNGILLVDLNEMNFLAALSRSEVFFIDVDSYQTPGFPATAIMDSIRDRHTAGFNQNSDWFSFGIVSFQLFTGIHPYKGKHPSQPDLEGRMQRNTSVFNPQVTIPKVCNPLDAIPESYRLWYRAVFEEGKRCPPPQELYPIIILAPVVQTVAASEKLVIKQAYSFPADIIFPIFLGAAYTAVTTDGLYTGSRKALEGSDLSIAITPRTGHLIAASIEGKRLRLYDVTTDSPAACEISAESMTAADGRLYVKQDQSLYEVQFVELPAKITAALRPVANVLQQATQVLDGVVVQNILGAYHVSIFPRSGVCHTIRAPEWDGHQVVDGKYDGNVLMIIAAKGGQYHKFILRFAPDCASYDLRLVRNIAFSALNFVTLDSGVCLHLEEDELELFSNRKDSQEIKVLSDPALAGGRLFKHGAQVYFTKGKALYSMTMKR